MYRLDAYVLVIISSKKRTFKRYLKIKSSLSMGLSEVSKAYLKFYKTFNKNNVIIDMVNVTDTMDYLGKKIVTMDDIEDAKEKGYTVKICDY